MKRYAEEISKTTAEAMSQEWAEVISKMDKDELKTSILYAIRDLIDNVKLYNIEVKKIKHATSSGISVKAQRLNLYRDMVYTKFFRLQNLVNAYEKQRVVITYVHVDHNGKREIRLYDNNAEHLMTRSGVSPRGNKYESLSYIMSGHYQVLQNAIPEETNQDLQETAQEVDERRQSNDDRIVYWQIPGRKLSGYKVHNKGAINEAFVNFYINTQPGQNYFNKDVEHNVATYIMHKRFGAIAADNMNGFLVGDIAKDKIQYAVKGAGASPQSMVTVIKCLKDLELNASHQDLQNALLHFKDESKKRVGPLIKRATEDQLNDLEKYLETMIKK